MQWFRVNLLATILAILAVSSSGAAELKVYANVDNSKDIYVGEDFTYQIIIDGYDQPGEVGLSPLAAYKPRSAGGGNNSQTSINIINGKTTTNVVRQYVMNYVLTAAQAGPMHIPPVTVTVREPSSTFKLASFLMVSVFVPAFTVNVLLPPTTVVD